MKRLIFFLLLILVVPFALLAQSPAGRIPKTIVADVLAQMPAKNQELYNKMMNDLASSSAECVEILTDMIAAPGKGDNTKVDYALGGLTFYVTTPGKDNEKDAVTKAYIKALDKATDREIKAFIIRQLQITGNDNSVDVLAKYAESKDLYVDAVAALTRIATPKAKKAISDLISSGKISDKKVAAKAAGDLALADQEDLILTWINSGDEATQKSVLYGLANCGTSKSLKTLTAAAAKAGYQYEATEANFALITLISRLPKEESIKAATKLMKSTSTAKGQYNTKASAVSILIDKQGKEAMPVVVAAMKDGCTNYRCAILKDLCPIADGSVYNTLYNQMEKLGDDAKIDIISWFGVRRAKEMLDYILPYITNDNRELSNAAMWAATKIGAPKGLTTIVNVMKENNKGRIEDATAALLSFKEGVAEAASVTLNDASRDGKIALIGILGKRNYKDAANTIIDLTKNSDSDISAAAYKALETVTSSKDLPTLYSMMESADEKNVKSIQSAISYALSSYEPKKALNAIDAQMIKTSEGKKHLYFALLSSTKAPEALDVVKNGISKGNENVKNAAIEAILTWNDLAATDILFDIMSNNTLSKYKDAAFGKYITLVGTSKYPAAQKYLMLRKAMTVASSTDQKNKVLAALGRCPIFGALILAGEYLGDSATEQAAGTAVMNIALKDKNIYGPQVTEILKKFLAVRKGGDAGYEKEAINKHLAELPSDEGFVSIFNGKDLSGWKGLVQNPVARRKMDATKLAEAQVKADDIMRKGWGVNSNGEIEFNGHGDNICADKDYGNFEMWIDWKLYAEGNEADAGIYLRGTPQVQMWDTARRNVGAQVGSGGLYNNSVNPSKPTKVADNKLGEWNTFYIKMVGERVTVYLNGELVVDNVILENYWDRSQPIFAKEQLELQAHGTRVAYRDIYIKELPDTKVYTLSDEEKKDGFEFLFDGLSMNKWVGNTTDYISEDGNIALYPSNGGGGNLYTKKEYGDFVFRFEFQLTDAANNGLGIRTPMQGDAAYAGMELQILDNEHDVYKDLKPYQYHGSVYGVIPSKRGFLKPIGEWNTQEVYIKGSHIKITLNGTVILDGDISEASQGGAKTVDGLDHPGLLNPKGYIGFLGHGSPVKFRNIRIKELNDLKK